MKFVSFCLGLSIIAGCQGDKLSLQLDGGEAELTNGTPGVGGDAVRAVLTDHVWLFTYEPEVTLDAELNGQANVSSGCLVANGHVVIWSDDTMPLAQQVLDSTADGGTVTVRLGGHESSTVPPAVGSRCKTETVWYCGREGEVISR